MRGWIAITMNKPFTSILITHKELDVVAHAPGSYLALTEFVFGTPDMRLERVLVGFPLFSFSPKLETSRSSLE